MCKPFHGVTARRPDANGRRPSERSLVTLIICVPDPALRSGHAVPGRNEDEAPTSLAKKPDMLLNIQAAGCDLNRLSWLHVISQPIELKRVVRLCTHPGGVPSKDTKDEGRPS